MPVQPEVLWRLTQAAARQAAAHGDARPASAAAVATTRARALEVILGYGPASIAGKPVYAVAMTGRFESYRGGPGREPLPHVAPYLVVVPGAATMEINDAGLRNSDPRERLPQLGPVTELEVNASK